MATSSWSTPSLAQVRQNNRDYLVGKLGVPIVPNSVARVLADANAGNIDPVTLVVGQQGPAGTPANPRLVPLVKMAPYSRPPPYSRIAATAPR